MSNLSEISPATERTITTSSADDARNRFKSRTLSIHTKFRLPRTYVMAILLCLLSFLEMLRNRGAMLEMALVTFSDKTQTYSPALEKWTSDDYYNYGLAIRVGDIFVKILGGLLIYRFSSHKFILVSVAVSSILHLLTPLAVYHHSLAFLLIVMVGQEISSASVLTAILSMWRYWAPPNERTVLLTISLLGAATQQVLLLIIWIYVKPKGGISTYIGIAGIIWVLFWYNVTSSTPQSDPLITEKEYFHLESNIPTNYQERTSLKEVPWLSMIKCKQVIFLFLIFFKLACSMISINECGFWIVTFYPKTSETDGSGISQLQKLMILFFVGFILVLLMSSVLMDVLLRKYRDEALRIRKSFMCTGFIMQSVFLTAAVIADGELVRAVFYALGYISFALSVPGVLRIPLDLAPRYVAIIAGFSFAFYITGKLCFMQILYRILVWKQKYYESGALIIDIFVSTVTGIIFGIWGEVEERTWSRLTPTRHTVNYRIHQQPDDEDSINLTLNA